VKRRADGVGFNFASSFFGTIPFSARTVGAKGLGFDAGVQPPPMAVRPEA
jgi:hypothetical protein